jgi:hypothetical protein
MYTRCSDARHSRERIGLLLRRRTPVGALVGILVAYLAFELDPLLLPALLFALFTVATLREHRTVLLATAALGTDGSRAPADRPCLGRSCRLAASPSGQPHIVSGGDFSSYPSRTSVL